MFTPERIDHAVGGEGGRSAEGVMHHHDLLDAEQMFHGRYGLQARDGPAAGNRQRKQRRRVPYPVTRFVEDILAGIDLAREMPGDHQGNFAGPGVEAVNDDGLQIDGAGEDLAKSWLVEAGLRAEYKLVERFRAHTYLLDARKGPGTPAGRYLLCKSRNSSQ